MGVYNHPKMYSKPPSCQGHLILWSSKTLCSMVHCRVDFHCNLAKHGASIFEGPYQVKPVNSDEMTVAYSALTFGSINIVSLACAHARDLVMSISVLNTCSGQDSGSQSRQSRPQI